MLFTPIFLDGERTFTYNILIQVKRINLIYISEILIKNIMSKQNLEKTFKKELEILNDQIDRKIIKGLSYAKESRRHKFILQSLNSLSRNNSQSNWFSKSFSLASFIL